MKTGETYSGDELIALLGGDENFVNDRLYALGNDDVHLVLLDVGNDNYQILDVIRVCEKRHEYEDSEIVTCPKCGGGDIDWNIALDYGECRSCGLKFKMKQLAVWEEEVRSS